MNIEIQNNLQDEENQNAAQSQRDRFYNVNPARQVIRIIRITNPVIWYHARFIIFIQNFVTHPFFQQNMRCILWIGYIMFTCGIIAHTILDFNIVLKEELESELTYCLAIDIGSLMGLFGILVDLFICFIKGNEGNNCFRVIFIVFLIAHSTINVMFIETFWNNYLYFSVTAIILLIVILYPILGIISFICAGICFVLFIGEFFIRLICCRLTPPCMGLLTRLNIEPNLSLQIQNLGRRIVLHDAPYNKLRHKQNNCAICLLDFEENQTVVPLECHETHIFHKKCLQDWVKVSTF